MGDARFRADGPAKVTGSARYAADWPAEDLKHIALVTAPVPAATITDVETSIAGKSPGVAAIITHRNARKLAPPVGAPYGGRLPLQDDQVCYEGEPVAIVVAATADQARDAAALVRIGYEPHAVATD